MSLQNPDDLVDDQTMKVITRALRQALALAQTLAQLVAELHTVVDASRLPR